ncbi:cytochrome b/b6 domain-containing protein [Sulfurimonas sp. HSL-1716]|uniref:cytochrome b/b6 domain-containing protein n=1 Tax=Hydrocurvibacter sulfurireducens TaxID=3131937 RepID=UPI0031F8B1EC
MKKWSASFRFWHWANAVVIVGLIGTVLLRKGFLSYKANAQIILDKLTAIDVSITLDQAKTIAKAIRAPMWEWHIILGYVLAFLVVYRILLFFTQSGKQSFRFKELNMHHKLVSMGYIGIYAVLFFMTISGLVIHFYQELGLLKDSADEIKDVHEAVYQVVLYFVPLHIIGVVIADIKEEKGIVSNIINGG